MSTGLRAFSTAMDLRGSAAVLLAEPRQLEVLHKYVSN